MAEEEKRYFTVRAVEALIPRLETIMTRVMDAQAEATRLRTALEAACKDTPVLPRPRVKGTRAELVKHFSDGRFVHQVALFAPSMRLS